MQGQQAQAKAPWPRVYLREADAGMWIVHDEGDSKGGCFRSTNRCRFVEDEFGADAQIVVQPQFPRQKADQPLQAIDVCRAKVMARY